MAAVRLGLEATYQTGIPTQRYQYTVVIDPTGVASVRNIIGPFGLIMDSMTRLPQSVVSDIQSSIAQLEEMADMTSLINGNLNFVTQTEQEVTFPTPLANTNYRVYLSPSDFVSVRVTNKTTTGFTVQVASTFSGTIGYDVFV